MRVSRFEKKKKRKWEPQMMEGIGQEKEKRACRVLSGEVGGLIQRMDMNRSQSIFVLT